MNHKDMSDLRESKKAMECLMESCSEVLRENLVKGTLVTVLFRNPRDDRGFMIHTNEKSIQDLGEFLLRLREDSPDTLYHDA